MADSFVRVPTDSTGKRVDATSLDVGADTVYRQRIVIGDNSATAQFAVVTGGALVVTGTMNISAMPTVTVTGGVAVSGTAVVSGNVNISATATVAGNVNISTMPAVTLAAGQVLDSISATVGVKGQVSLGAGTSNIGFINNISATVVVAGVVALTAGTAVIGDLNAISRTVQVAVGTPFTLQGISTTVTVAGNINLSATATAIIGAVLDATDATPVRVGDSANTAIRVNVVAGSSGGVSQVDGTTFSTQAANFVPIGGVFDDAATNTLSENDAGAVRLTTNRGMHVNLRTDGGAAVEDSANAAIRVNVVAGSSGGVSQVDGTTFSTQAANFVPIGGIFDDAASDTLSENDAGVCRLTTNRALHVNLRTAGGSEISAGAPLSVKVEQTSATASVILAAGAAVIGDLNAISRTVQVAVGTPFTLQGISTTVQVAVGTPFTVNNISATVLVAGTVSLGAGTAVIGDLNAISRTVQVAIGTPFTLQGISTTVLVAMSNQTIQGISTTVTVAGVVGLTAGAANIGFINNISATVVAVLNTSAAIPSVSRGPMCVTASTSAGVALISAPGAGNFIYITQIACTNGSGTLTRADVFAASQTATCIAQMYMAASGGGFVLKYDPPVRVQSNTQVTCRVDPNVSQAIFNVHFYVQNT